MKKENIRKGRNATIVCILLGVVYFWMMKASGLITGLLFKDLPDIMRATIKEGLYGVSAVLLMKLTGNSLFRRRKIKGAKPFPQRFIYLFTVVLGIKCIVEMKSHSFSELRPVPEIIAFVLYMLFVGIAEECVFRGIIAESLIRTFGRDAEGKRCAVFVSGMLFGLFHLINLAHSDVVGVLCQVFAASVVGMVFAEFYYRYHSLWAMILLHAAIDFSGLICYGLFNGSTPRQVISSYTPVMLIPYAIVFAVWLLHCRKRINPKTSVNKADRFHMAS